MTTTCGYVLPRRSQFEIEKRILILSWTSLSKQKRAGAERGCTACPRFHDGDQPAKRRHQGRALHSASLERVLSASASIRSRRSFSSERCCSCIDAQKDIRAQAAPWLYLSPVGRGGGGAHFSSEALVG